LTTIVGGPQMLIGGPKYWKVVIV